MHRHIAGKLTGRTTKWVVLGFWVVALVALAGFAQKLTDVQDNEASSWLPSSAESTKALERLNVFQDENDIPTVIVYHRAGGLTQEDLTTIKGQLPAISAQEGVVGQAKDPVTSRDGEVAQSVVTYNFGKDGWNSLPDAADKLRDVVAIPGVTTYISGQGGQAADSATAFAGIDGTLLIVTLAIVILILLLTYRSPWLWLLPIISAVFALFIAEGIIYFLAKYADLTVNGQSQSILTVLVLGAGTDYALLLVARYREELRKHEDRHEAMAVALHRATPAIIASSSTVAIGMLCLMFAEMNSTAGLGPVNAIGLVVTLLVMITLLPALLVICGRWISWPMKPTYDSQEPTATGLWAKVGQGIAPRPRLVWVVTALILGVVALNWTQLDSRGLTTADQYTKHVGSTEGQDLLADHGLIDDSTPIQVVAKSSSTDQVVAAIEQVPGVDPPDTSVPPIDG